MTFIILLFISFSAPLADQTHPFKGRVIENDAYRTPLYGATVWFPDLDTGTTTSLNGYFSFEGLPEGEHLIRISFVGYRTLESTIRIPSAEEPVFALEMDPQILDELEVLADAEESVQMQQTGLSTIRVSALPLTNMPRLMGEPDLIRMIQNLPGVKAESDFTGGFFVRGGRNDQNLILLDGVPVYNPWHLFGIFSAFNTEALGRVELTKGVFPAKYGSRVSSVLDIGLQQGSERHGAGYLTVSPLSSSFSYGRPLNQNTSYLVSLRRTYMDPVFWILNRSFSTDNQFEKHNSTLGYYFYDLNVKLVHRFTPRTRLEAAWFRSSDQLEISDETIEKGGREERYIDRNINGWRNNTGSIRLHHRTSRLVSETQAFITFYNSDNTEKHEDINSLIERPGIPWITTGRLSEYRFDQRFRDFGLQQHGSLFAGGENRIYFGGQWMLHNFRDVSTYREREVGYVTGTDGSVPSPEQPSDVIYDWFVGDSLATRAHEAAAYLSGTVRFGDVVLHPGVRYEFYSLGSHHGLMPRINASWQVTPSMAISVGYGHFSQYIQVIGLDLVRLPTDRWFWSNRQIKPVTSRMATLGFGYDAKQAGRITVEGYYKTMNNLLNFSPYEQQEAYGNADFFIRFGSETIRSTGEAYGVELFWEKPAGTVTGWLGYTLSWSWNQFSDLNSGQRFPSRTDKRHDLQLFLNWDFAENWSVGALFNYKTGQPLTFTTGHYIAEPDPLGIGDRVRSTLAITERNAFRLPPYHRLDLNLTWKNRRMFKRRAELSLNVINVYNRFNVFSAESSTMISTEQDNRIRVNPRNEYLGQLPVLPVVSLRIALGGDAN